MLFDGFFRQFVIHRRHAEVCGTLKHMQMLGLFSHYRNRLNARGAGTNDADPLAGEINFVVRPLTGVIPLTFKVIQPFKVGRGNDKLPEAMMQKLADTTSPAVVVMVQLFVWRLNTADLTRVLN